MAYLILSDIHANLEALQAVLADAEGCYDCILCLGDVVGYGADPNAVTDWVREEATAVVRGNHDRAAVGSENLETFNPAARASAMWTRRALTADNLRYLDALERGPLRIEEPLGVFNLVHGSPLHEDHYVVELEDALLTKDLLTTQVTFFGHTHLQGGFLFTPRNVAALSSARTLELEPDYFYLLNPGSVGQPRDGDRRAAYAVFSMEDQTVEYRRVEYDIDKAANKILAAGMPEILGTRLYQGM
ncbi:MAG: metallophosphoesterase family protein [Acidobacteriota bacterium]